MGHSLVQKTSFAEFKVLSAYCFAADSWQYGLSQRIINNTALAGLQTLRARDHRALGLGDGSSRSEDGGTNTTNLGASGDGTSDKARWFRGGQAGGRTQPFGI